MPDYPMLKLLAKTPALLPGRAGDKPRFEVLNMKGILSEVVHHLWMRCPGGHALGMIAEYGESYNTALERLNHFTAQREAQEAQRYWQEPPSNPQVLPAVRPVLFWPFQRSSEIKLHKAGSLVEIWIYTARRNEDFVFSRGLMVKANELAIASRFALRRGQELFPNEERQRKESLLTALFLDHTATF